MSSPSGATVRADGHLPLPQWPRRAALTLRWEWRVLRDGLQLHASERSQPQRAAVTLTFIVISFFFIALYALLAASATIVVPPYVVWRCARELWGPA